MVRPLITLLIGTCLVLATAVSCTAPGPNLAESSVPVLRLATGSVRGVYYPVGQAIASELNQHQQAINLHISPEDSHGSIANLNMLSMDRIQLAIVQYDLFLAALAGKGQWQGHPMENLALLGVLYSENVTLLASEASGIRQLDDLRGKRINLGQEGSGHHHNAKVVLDAMGQLQAVVPTLKGARQSIQSLGGSVDATFLTIGHPAPVVADAWLHDPPPRVIPITGEVVERILESNKGLIPASIQARAYGEHPPEPIPTIGVPAVLIAHKDMPNEVVRPLMQALVKEIPHISRAHPVLQPMTPLTLASAPSEYYHPAALEVLQGK